MNVGVDSGSASGSGITSEVDRKLERWGKRVRRNLYCRRYVSSRANKETVSDVLLSLEVVGLPPCGSQ